MARRWLKNAAVASRNEMAQTLYWFLTYVTEFIVVDVDTAGNWPRLAYGTNAILDAALPFTFRTPVTDPYLFTAADIGRKIAIRDEVTTLNSGVYTVSAIVDSHTVHLATPGANFAGYNGNAQWVLFDPASAPPDDAYFVIQSPVTDNPWQARVIPNATIHPIAGLSVEMGAWGGWNAGTGLWGLPVTSSVVIPNISGTMFCVADEQLGAFFNWVEDGAGDRNGIYCGQMAALHSPAGAGVPKDSAPSALLGSNTVNTNALNRLLTGGFASNGQISLPDNSGYATAYLHQWERTVDDVDPFTIAAGMADPRSTQIDAYQFLVYQTTPVVSLRGIMPLIYMLNDAVPNRTLVNSGLVYGIQDGIGCEWDGSTPF